MIRCVVVVLAFLVFVPVSCEASTIQGPSFECKAATTAVELLICGNSSLSAEDLELSATYRWLIGLSGSLPVDKENLLKDQRAWLASRSRVCSAVGNKMPSRDIDRFKAIVCLLDLYKSRRAALFQISEDAERESRNLGPIPLDKISTDDISEGEELQNITRLFQKDGLRVIFDQPHITVESCDEAVSLIIQGVGRDSSYGAHCKVRIAGGGVDVLMCNDYMIGKFSIKLSESTQTRASVVEFIEKSCPPGG